MHPKRLIRRPVAAAVWVSALDGKRLPAVRLKPILELPGAARGSEPPALPALPPPLPFGGAFRRRHADAGQRKEPVVLDVNVPVPRPVRDYAALPCHAPDDTAGYMMMHPAAP